MTVSKIDPEKAWQMVIESLRMEMSLGSFKTYVQDAEFISLGNGTLTIGVSNPYACEWLADRLTSTVNRMVNGILDLPVTVQFVVHEKSLPEEDDSVEEENPESESPHTIVTLQAVYQSVYDEIVQPEQVIVVPGYFLRYIPMLGLELSWLYIGFRQAAYEAGASKRPGKKIGAPAKKVACYAGISPRTFWRWAGKPDTWKLLRWLVKPVEEKTHWTRGTDGRPHQATHYYRVAMTMPLTPFDELSLRSWLYRKLSEGKRPLVILQEAFETPLDELLPWPEKMPSLEEINGDPHSVQDVLKAVCDPIAESEQVQFNELTDKLAEYLMPSRDLIFLTHYFVSHWLPRLGSGPGWFVTLLRDRCYFNRRTGEIRDEVRLEQGYAEGARWLGLKRVKTIWEWLRSADVAIFLCEMSRENGTWEEAPRRIKVCLGEPMTDEDQDQANTLLARSPLGASVTHSNPENIEAIGASDSHNELINDGAVGASVTHRKEKDNVVIGASVTHSDANVESSVGASCTRGNQQIGASDSHSGAIDTHKHGASGTHSGASGEIGW